MIVPVQTRAENLRLLSLWTSGVAGGGGGGGLSELVCGSTDLALKKPAD